MNLLKKRPFRFSLQIIVIALLILIDKLIKDGVYEALPNNGTVVVIPKVLGFTYAENTGAAFSMFSSSTNALSVVTGIALVACVVLLFFLKPEQKIYHITIPFIAAGGAGNLLDRITRGFVIDYIQTLFISFPVFNFADCLITCACFALIIYLIYDTVKDMKKNNTAEG